MSNKRTRSVDSECGRDSLSERICDDLCELFFQYLPLEDKLKLECVSKQFQRTLFQRQYDLRISRYQIDMRCYSKGLFRSYYLNLKTFVILLKKCPNLRSIKIREYFQNIDDIIASIIQYCDNLVEFKYKHGKLRIETKRALHEKFGQKLKIFEGLSRTEDLTLFPNIEELKLFHFNHPQVLLDSAINFKKLKRFVKFIFPMNEEESLINECLLKFNKIRYLYLNWPHGDYKQLKTIPKLVELIEFKVKQIYLEKTQFAKFCKDLVIKCPKLKSFECDLRIMTENDFSSAFISLKSLINLKRLTLNFQIGLKVKDWIVFRTIKNLSNITHLTMRFTSDHDNFQFIRNTILEDIGENIPQLQHLVIYGRLRINKNNLKKIVNSLHKLPKLQTVKLIVYSGINKEKIEKEIRANCKKINTIDLNVPVWVP